MGNVEQIDELETYIKDLGDEIGKVKKASDYLKLIEEFQAEIKKTSSTLNHSNDQLKLFQKIIESNLELYHSTIQNIETKQKSLEHSLSNISSNLSDMKNQQERNERGMVNSFQEMNKLVNEKHNIIVGDLTKAKDDQISRLDRISKSNKLFFIINTIISISVLALVVFLLMN